MTDDDFDPSAAAARAVGDLADEDVGGDAPTPDSTSTEESGSPDDEDSGPDSDSDSKGMLATVILPLFLASERGPTSSTFQNHDIGEGLSLILDGFTDYLLDLAGRDDVGDNLGPAGKIGLGMSRLQGDSGSGSSTTTESDDDRGDEGDDANETTDIDGAEAI